MGIVFTHWSTLADLSAQQVIFAVERLSHATAHRPQVTYPIDRTFYKFPSYYRRAAIAFAVGQVKSFVTRYQQWQSGTCSHRDAKPPPSTVILSATPSCTKGSATNFMEKTKSQSKCSRAGIGCGRRWPSPAEGSGIE
ncbi:hypothetical protein [Thermosynechococcus sp. FA-CM-4201]